MITIQLVIVIKLRMLTHINHIRVNETYTHSHDHIINIVYMLIPKKKTATMGSLRCGLSTI